MGEVSQLLAEPTGHGGYPAGLETDNSRDFPAETGSLMELTAQVMAHSEQPEPSKLSLCDMWHLRIPTIFMYF